MLTFCTAAPPCWSERDPNVPVPTGTRSVSPWTTSMRSISMPSSEEAIIDHDGVVSLAVR